MSNIHHNKPRPKILNTIIYILACIGVLILILGLLFPKEFSTEVETSIKAEPQQVYNVASNILNTEHWWSYIANEVKPSKISLSDIKAANGATLSFTDKNGEGYFRIDKLDSNKTIGFTISTDGREASHTLSLSKNDDGTTATWNQISKLSYPKNAFFPFIKYRWNKEAKASANLLEKEVTKRINDTSYYGYKIKQRGQNIRYFQTIRNTVTYDKFGQNYSQNIAAIYQKLAAEGIATKGFPCTVIYNYDQVKGTIDMAAAVEVITPLNIKDLTLESFPPQNTAFVEYFGDSAKNEPAHWALSDYVSDRSYSINLPVIEEYVTDPLKEKDPTKWQTNIYYYIIDKK
jgi:effector-binding domain-containing protein